MTCEKCIYAEGFEKALKLIACYDFDGRYCESWKHGARALQALACEALGVAKGFDLPEYKQAQRDLTTRYDCIGLEDGSERTPVGVGLGADVSRIRAGYALFQSNAHSESPPTSWHDVGALLRVLDERVQGEGLTFPRADTDTHVYFYERDFYPLGNFSAFVLDWKGLIFPTSEHAYHWEKFVGHPSLQDQIRHAPSAHEAFKLAERWKAHRAPGWQDVKADVMRDILRAKVKQHGYVMRKLLATGDRVIVEDSWRDAEWGCGPNGDGQNLLGKLWMEVRAEARDGRIPAAPLRTVEGGALGGAELIAAERTRQVAKECWSATHDDAEHDDAGLTRAAILYAKHAAFAIRGQPFDPVLRADGAPLEWPWQLGDWKPKDPVRNLVRAGALIAAEIDRLQRAKGESATDTNSGVKP